jgi:hypothetical protein
MDETTIEQAVAQLKSIGDMIDPDDTVITYDQDSDTIHVHFFGRVIPAVSLLLNDEMMIRWDRAGRRVVGLQIERFLRRVAPLHPELLDLMDIADLQGISLAEVGEIRRSVAQGRRGSVLDRVVKDLDAVTSAAD